MMRSITKWLKRLLRRHYREWQLRSIYHEPIPSALHTVTKPCIIHVLNNTLKHGGLLDRIKGIVSLYQLAKELDYDFKIFVDPQSFDLFKYLQPKQTELICLKDEFWLNRKIARPLYLNDYRPDSKGALLQLFSSDYLQFHVYGNQDYIPLLQPLLTKDAYGAYWAMLFHQLFSFVPELIHHAGLQLMKSDASIVGIHSRFMGLLGDFEDVNDVRLEASAQQYLLNDCLKAVDDIASLQQHHLLLVVSDSVRFLQAVKLNAIAHGYDSRIIIDEKNIGHIDVNHHDDVLLKAFSDFYLLCQCKKIYQIRLGGMYRSQFSRYASYIADTTLQEVTLLPL